MAIGNPFSEPPEVVDDEKFKVLIKIGDGLNNSDAKN